MKEQYFIDLTSSESIKTRFKELAKKYHPDLGGCVEIMKEINAQYEKVLEGFYQKGGKSLTEIEELLKGDVEVRNKLCEVLGYPNLIVEVCGAWIWVTGETKIVKEVLKSAGFYWASKKEAWYWRRKEDASHGGRNRNYSLDEIRLTHGRQVITEIKRTQKIA